MPNALVCGAGIAGLTAAAYLKKAGFNVRVFERHGELRAAGVGLNIWPNGVRVIRGLGLGDAFAEMSSTTLLCQSLDQHGEMTSDVDVSDWEESFGAPLAGARRRELTELLGTTLSPDELVFGRTAERFEQDDVQVSVVFDDGTRVSGDVLVGADGVGSRIRRAMLGGEPEFLDDSPVRWRGVFSCVDAGIDEGVQVDVIGDAGHFGWIPIGGGDAYWFATADGRDGFREIMDYFSAWTSTPVPRVIAATPEQTIIRSTLLAFRDHLERWVSGRVVLIGDAAHPMFPGMAQGANQALEDAEALARHLAGAPDIPKALARFESERIPIANRMVEYSRMLFDFEESEAAYSREHENQLLARYVRFERWRDGRPG